MYKAIAYTALALVAFAANSVLARLALATDSIDAASFTIVRLLSGVVILLALSCYSGGLDLKWSKSSLMSSIYLFGYMALFSFAYLSLATGAGALILFGAVQIVLMTKARLSGERWNSLQSIGFIIAAAGFVYLVWPNLATPSVWAALMMMMAGVCWAAYTIAGKKSVSPLADTTKYFVWTIPLLLPLLVYALWVGHVSVEGLIYAVLSGAVASGLGYAIWFKALPLLTTTQASVLQLLVPVIAAVGGLWFSSESLSFYLLVSSLLVLGGVFMVLMFKPKAK